MRKVTFGGGNSLDNFITGPDEAIDWLRWSDDAAAISAASLRVQTQSRRGRDGIKAG